MKKILFLFLFLSISSVFLFSKTPEIKSADIIKSEEEFRWGVVTYNQGLFNKAILSFETVLALDPENTLARLWLGKSYYQSGYDDAALKEWNHLIEKGLGSSALINFVSLVKERRSLRSQFQYKKEYIELYEIEPQESFSFNAPLGLSPSPTEDGSFYFLSYLKGDLFRVNALGEVQTKSIGGLKGLNRPFDLVFTKDKNLIVSQYGADQLSLFSPSGFTLKTIGSKGIGPGELLGPQFLAMEKNGSIYVSEWGNKRISKFNKEGEFLLSFGSPQSDFKGLLAPTGIAIKGNSLFVADKKRKTIEEFDQSGNHIRTLISEKLKEPEDIIISQEGTLLISDGPQILQYDFNSKHLSSILENQPGESPILSFCEDSNGNLIKADFDNSRLAVLGDRSSLYAGLMTKIEGIETKAYPLVEVNVSVEDPWGKPIVGLEQKNFLLRENNQALSSSLINRISDKNSLALSIIVDKGLSSQIDKKSLELGLGDLFKRLNEDDTVFLRSSSLIPQLFLNSSFNFEKGLALINQNWGDFEDPSSAFRLGASDLIGEPKKRVLLYLSDGYLGEESFSKYSLSHLLDYFKNNHIAFYPLYTKNTSHSSLEFLAKESGGNSLVLTNPEGLSSFILSLRSKKNGLYTLEFNSQVFSDYGRAYIPLSVKVDYIQKSGRDESGYFAPLEY